jgi:phage anti-repressor protein
MKTEILNIIDIIDIIEKNPIIKLSKTYNNKLLTKIKETFTENQQQLFISSFYLYLNYNKDDFVISLDNIWEWLGFNQKEAIKRVLVKNFIENKDYSFRRSAESKREGRGGSTKEIILLTVKCFKLLCIKAGTKKANEIHEYFIKLEELLQDVILEECNEVKLQLENKDKEYEIKLKKEKQLERQQILLKEYATIGSIVYIIKIKSFDDGTNKNSIMHSFGIAQTIGKNDFKRH